MLATSTRREPFAELGELRSRLDRMFGEPGGREGGHDGVVEVTIPLPKEPEKQRIEIKPTAA